MSLHSVIAQRQHALFNAWKANSFHQVQVASVEDLRRQAFIDDLDLDVTVEKAGRRSLRNAVVVRREGNLDANSSVWVRADYSGYQKAWLAFIKQVYGIEGQAADLAGYNVDHLLNRARSPGGNGFIRIEAINASVNQAWGRLFEKAASNPEFYANQQRFGRKLTWLIAAKLMGQMPPRGPNDRAGIDRLVAFFNAQGMADENPREGLTNLLEFGYRFR